MELPFGIREFFDNFLIYHYIFAVLIFLISLTLLSLGIFFRKKHFLAAFFYLFSFISVAFAPFVGFYYIEEYLRGSSLKNLEVTRLVYTPAIVLTAEIKNNGAATLKKTNLLFSVVKKNNNSILQAINIFKPARTQKITIKHSLKAGQSESIRVVLDISKIQNPNSYSLYYRIKSF